METLNVHSHFASTLNSSPYHQFEQNHQKESIQNPTKNWTNCDVDRANIKVHQPKAKVNSFCDERKSIEEAFSTKTMSTNESLTALSRENSPAVFASEPFVADTLGDIDDNVEREYFMRCLVLGAESAGKHTLINANFSEGSREISEGNGVNLVIKTAIRNKTTKKYHFWIRSLSEKDNTIKETIWQTYYKRVNAFVFVYDTTDKKSFEVLEEAVKNVLKVVPKEKFFGVLVGTKNDLYNERQVDYNAVIELKQKYNFKHSVETNSSIEHETPQMLPRLDSKLKLTFESI